MLGQATSAFLGRAAHQIAPQGATDAIEVDAVMLEETRVFPHQQGVDESRRNFVQRNDQPIRSCQSAINFPINIENSIALRHFADLFHVEGVRPGGVKDQNAQPSSADEAKK